MHKFSNHFHLGEAGVVCMLMHLLRVHLVRSLSSFTWYAALDGFLVRVLQCVHLGLLRQGPSNTLTLVR